MSPLENLRQQLRDKMAAFAPLSNPVTATGETRELTTEESTRFDSLFAECETLKRRIANLEALGEAPAATTEGPAQRSAPVGAPAIHVDTKKPKTHRILRAISLMADGRAVDGFEGEVSTEIARRTGRHASGLFIPTGSDPVIREMLGYGMERRDLTTVTGTGGIYNLFERPLIEILRAKLVIQKLGARIMEGVHGNFSMTAQTGTSTTYWLGEGVPTSLSNPVYGQIPFTPKVAISATQVSRQYINQTSLDFESDIKNDIALQMAVELDRVVIDGSGVTQPLGLLQNPDIAVVSSGSNGGFPTFESVVNLQSEIANLNADAGKLAYLTSPAVRGYLKVTGKTTNGYPVFIWEDSATEAGVGEVNGTRALVTTNVPSNLTKGTGTNLSAMIYGNFDDLVVPIWEGIELSIVNPYSAQLAGAVIISNTMSVDANVRRPQSFVVANDVQYSGVAS